MPEILHCIKTFPSACRATALCLLLAGCGEPNERLDEYVFYSGPQLKLKVVRYYRNIPFNYLGEHAVVMCQSENTARFQADNALDAGWRVLGAAGGEHDADAQAVAQRVQQQYQVIDERTLVATLRVFNISFDACGQFASWDPTRLPPAMINAVEKPDSCAPQGPVDCRYLDFEGERTPRYEELDIDADRQVRFTVSSGAFRNLELLRVFTPDQGNIWHVDTVSSDNPQLNPATLRQLPVAPADDGTEGTSLVDWLATLLPQRSLVIWPDHVDSCGNAVPADGNISACATVQFNDTDGNSGELVFALPEAADNGSGTASFHSGRYTLGGASRPVNSLRELPGLLATPRRR